MSSAPLPSATHPRHPARSSRLLPLVALLLGVAPAPAQSAPTQPQSSSRAVMIPAVAISPDARALVYSSGPEDSLNLVPLTGSPTPKPISAGPSCTAADPVWSPDSSTLAFLAGCNNSPQQQIYLYSVATGQSRQLTHVTGNLQHLRWAPDGKYIGFLFVENATRHAGALDAMKPWSGVIGEDGIEPQRVALADASSGLTLQVTPVTLHAFEFSWAPDSHSLALIAAPNPGENNWWVAKLYRADLQLSSTTTPGGSSDHLNVELHTLLDPQTIAGPLHGLQIAVPRISPDGEDVAFIGGLMSDQGSTGGDVYTLPIAGGDPVNLTPGRPASPAWLHWTAPHTLEISEDARGYTHLFLFNTETRQEDPAQDLRYMGSLSSGGIKDAVSTTSGPTPEIAVVRSSFNAPPEVWAGPIADLRQITHLNDNLHSSGLKTESVEWTNDNFHIQGWLTYPRTYDPSQKYPIIVSVHGGPSASIGAHWGNNNPFADAGYFVFQPNPRGSFGQGEAFTAANRKDFGYGDLRDILAGLDSLEQKLPIDHNREGLTGWSYGGFMTMFAVTQTHRFHAAVAGAGISDWKSYYGENSIDQWMTPFFGDTVYNDPAVYAKSSAIEFIKNVTTPTLVIVGDRDGECPAPQSFEFWHALRAENVPTQLVIYPNEGHGFRDPAHIADRTRRELAWFNQYLSSTPASTPQQKTGN